MAQLDPEASVAIRRDRLEYLKSGKAENTLDVVGTLGIDDDPALINGNTAVYNKIAKYVNNVVLVYVSPDR